MKHFKFIFLFVALFIAACSNETPNTSIGVEDDYIVTRLQKLYITTGAFGDGFKWEVTSTDGESKVLSEERKCLFIADKSGNYTLTLTISDNGEEIIETSTISVLPEDIEYKANFTKVHDYAPAPGQFINELPPFDEGDTKDIIIQKAESSLAGGSMVSLGTFGGYIVVGFDHTIYNKPDSKDFLLGSNAIENGAECGVVSVSVDSNENGIADDEWFELAGSEYNNSETIKNYRITYYRPDENKTAVKGEAGVTDAEYIAWRDNLGGSGFVEKNSFHNHSYWPLWDNGNELTFTGTRLPDNYTKTSSGQYKLAAYGWGYADNHPNKDTEGNSFDIDWAVNSKGEKVNLIGIDFIKVHSGLLQNCGWIGESSTEFLGAEDLNL